MEKNKDGKEKRPRVGIGVMILNKNNDVLLGLRQGSHGAGEWSFPGGHLEFGDTIFETAQRETKEETGLDVEDFKLISVADEMRYIKSDGKHYLNISVKANYDGGEPRVCEPDKCVEWKWFNIDTELPEHMFEATDIAINNYKSGNIYNPNSCALV